MKLVRFVPTFEISPGNVFQIGEVYTVHTINFSLLTGVMFGFIGFGDANYFHANHFRTPNGKSADRVQALPDTEAFTVYSGRILHLVGLKRRRKDGAELVFLGPSQQTRPLPYSEFMHV